MELIKNLIRLAWLAISYVYHLVNFTVKDTTVFVFSKDLDTKASARTHISALLDEFNDLESK